MRSHEKRKLIVSVLLLLLFIFAGIMVLQLRKPDKGESISPQVASFKPHNPAAAPSSSTESKANVVKAGEMGTPSLIFPEREKVPTEPEVRGMVLDDKGNPVAGALVRAIQADSSAKKFDAEAVTEKDGTYVLKRLKFDCPYPYKLIASAAGYASTPSELLFSRKPPDQLNIRLVKGVPIRGRAVTADGEGIEGAAVTLIESSITSEHFISLYTDFEIALTAQTNAQGEYIFPHVLPGEYWLYVQAPTFFDGTRLISVSLNNASRNFDFRLDHAGDKLVAGTVFDEKSGLPLEGVLVSARNITSSREGKIRVTGRMCCTSRKGEFSFQGLPEHSNISAIKSGYNRKEIYESDFKKGGENLKVYLKPFMENAAPGTATGRVFDAVSLKPITDFTVAVLRRNTDFFWGEKSYCVYSRGFDSPDGSFSFDNLEQGIIHVLVNSTGYGTQVVRAQVYPDDYPKDKIYIAKVGLKPEAAATGVIRDVRTGHPVAGVQVKLNCDWSMATPIPISRSIFTDEFGRYELRGVPEGPHRLMATHPDYAPAISEEIQFSANKMQDRINFSLGAGGSLEGVIDDPYKEQAGVVLIFQQIASPVLSQEVGSSFPTSPFLRPPRFAQTDEYGRFRLDGLTPGYYLLWAHLYSGDSAKFDGTFPVDIRHVIETREGETTIFDIPICSGKIEGTILFDKATEPDLKAGRGYYAHLRAANAPPVDLTVDRPVIEAVLNTNSNSRWHDWGFRFTGICGGEYTVTLIRYERTQKKYMEFVEQKSVPVMLREYGKAEVTVDLRHNRFTLWRERGEKLLRSLSGAGESKKR